MTREIVAYICIFIAIISAGAAIFLAWGPIVTLIYAAIAMAITGGNIIDGRKKD